MAVLPRGRRAAPPRSDYRVTASWPSRRRHPSATWPQVAQWCRSGETDGLRRCSVLLTAASGAEPIFPDAPSGGGAEAERELGGLENAAVLRSRLTPEIVADAVRRMPPPCRVVVSGPAGFNSAARGMLAELVDENHVTVLAA